MVVHFTFWLMLLSDDTVCFFEILSRRTAKKTHENTFTYAGSVEQSV